MVSKDVNEEVRMMVRRLAERESQMRKELESEYTRGMEDGYADGYNDGYSQGLRDGYEKGECEVWDVAFSEGYKAAKDEL